MKHRVLSFLSLGALILFFAPIYSNSESHAEKKQIKLEMHPRRDSKLEKQCKNFATLIKKHSKKEKNKEKFIEKLLEESFLHLHGGSQVIDLIISFEQLYSLLRELKSKDLIIFFKGSAVRNQANSLFNLLERIKETSNFVKKIEQRDATRDSINYIYPFLTHYLFIVAHAAKITSLFVEALKRAQESSITQRAARLNNTMVALLLDLQHISFTLNTLRGSLKAFHSKVTF